MTGAQIILAKGDFGSFYGLVAISDVNPKTLLADYFACASDWDVRYSEIVRNSQPCSFK